MGCAAVAMPFPDAGADQNIDWVRTAIRREADKFALLLASLLMEMGSPTLQELSNLLLETRSVLLGGILKALSVESACRHGEATHSDCPRCGRRVQRMRLDDKTVSTINGPFDLQRPYFYCKTCQLGFHPLDESLGLAREVHQYDLQETFALFTARMPYAEAAELFTKATGLPAPGAHFGHDNLNRIAQAAQLDVVIPDSEEIERRIEKAKGGSEELPVLVVATDGAHAPTRPKGGRKGKRGQGAWREVKGFRLYLLGEDDRVIHIAGWHRIADWEELTSDLELVAGRIPSDKVRVVLLGDGADWVWKVMSRSFPEARQVLDYFHMAEHISKVAKAQYGDTLEAQQWREATITRLFLDKTGYVIGGLRRMTPISPTVGEEIRKLIGYLMKNVDRLGYQQCRDEGLPIGSGGIESANKFISHARLKLSGAWWLEGNVNAMLRIRCAIYNGTFETVFKSHVAKRNREIRDW